MTVDEFFEKLEQTPRYWKIFDGGLIRTDSDPRFCPVCAVNGNSDWYSEWQTAALELGLEDIDGHEIACAADCLGHPLRARLLKACGL